MSESLSQVLDRIEQAIIESLQGGSAEFAIAKVPVSDLRRIITALEQYQDVRMVPINPRRNYLKRTQTGVT